MCALRWRNDNDEYGFKEYYRMIHAIGNISYYDAMILMKVKLVMISIGCSIVIAIHKICSSPLMKNPTYS